MFTDGGSLACCRRSPDTLTSPAGEPGTRSPRPASSPPRPARRASRRFLCYQHGSVVAFEFAIARTDEEVARCLDLRELGCLGRWHEEQDSDERYEMRCDGNRCDRRRAADRRLRYAVACDQTMNVGRRVTARSIFPLLRLWSRKQLSGPKRQAATKALHAISRPTGSTAILQVFFG